ncbi:MAG: hypothetical protein K5639_08750 [Eubacterium sp.]|nr:hypothetical protein [Eubacterium sp.]
MSIKDFVENYIMHDSLIDSVNISDDGTKIEVQIDFAFWMQKNYVESDPETGIISVVFAGVTYYEVPKSVNWDEISILETKMENQYVKFLLINDMTDDYLEMVISAEEVSVQAE